MIAQSLFRRSESEWISISDLMAGLMMIFLFIAISYMNSLQIRARQIKEIAVAYQVLQEDLYNDLLNEFKNDLPRWKAEIDKDTLTIIFREPEVLFKQNSYIVTSRFKDILIEFFPRYILILSSPKYGDSIDEIRIEGHTSSEWRREVDSELAYFLNMKLSQDRTRSVLEYCLGLIGDPSLKTWTRKYLTANGLSSSHLVLVDGIENRELSRRVEFRTKTAAEKKVVEIIEKMKDE